MVFSDVTSEPLKGSFVNNFGVDYGIIFGNKGGFFMSLSPGVGFGLDLGSVASAAQFNYVPANLYTAGKLNWLSYKGLFVFSELAFFGQIGLDKNSVISPYGLIWHQLGIGYNFFTTKTIMSFSCGFLQSVQFMSPDAFRYTFKALVLDDTSVGSDFRLWGMISASLIYKITKKASFRIALDYIIPISMFAPAKDYFLHNNILFANIGFRRVW